MPIRLAWCCHFVPWKHDSPSQVNDNPSMLLGCKRCRFARGFLTESNYEEGICHVSRVVVRGQQPASTWKFVILIRHVSK